MVPRFQRAFIPPPMRLTERDKRILEAVHAHDGMLGFSQIRRMFFTGESQAKNRLKLLYQNKYLNRPNKEQRRRVPEMIYWLDKWGAQIVASLNGESTQEFSWRKQPRWFQIEHDLAVSDFRLDIKQACQEDPNIHLKTWIPESEFWSYPDEVNYEYQGKSLKRKIRPDAYFMLKLPNNNIRYLLEIDRGTEDNPRFRREKILPGLAYINTQAYKTRFGLNSGRWLVVTTGEKRLANMLRQAKNAKTGGKFYFTTFEKLNAETILHVPIWKRGDKDELVPLVFMG